MRSISTAVLALGTALCLAGPALAQSTGAPAGEPAATTPGGTEGQAGPRNEMRAIERGDAIPAAPGVGIPVETERQPGTMRREEAPPPSRP